MKGPAVGKLFSGVSQVGRVLRRERRAGVRGVAGEVELERRSLKVEERAVIIDVTILCVCCFKSTSF